MMKPDSGAFQEAYDRQRHNMECYQDVGSLTDKTQIPRDQHNKRLKTELQGM